MELTWRQTTNYGLQSGCGNYRIAKCKVQAGWRYIPFAQEECLNAHGKEVKRWFPVSKPMRTADDAKSAIGEFIAKKTDDH